MRWLTALLVIFAAWSGQADEPLPEDRGGLVAIAIDPNSDGDRRRYAVAALREHDSEEIRQLVRELMRKDPDPFVRIAAAETVVALQGEEARAFLMVARTDEKHPGVLSALNEMLARLRPLVPFERLVELLRAQRSPDDQRRLLVEISRHAVEAARPVLEASLRFDPDPGVRGFALELLASRDPPRGVELATELATSNRAPAALRGAAIRVLGHHAQGDARSGPLVQLLADASAAELYLEVARVAARYGITELIAPLREQLTRATDPAERNALVAALLPLSQADGAGLSSLIAALGELPQLNELPAEHAVRLVESLGRFGTEAHGEALAAQLSRITLVELVDRIAAALARIASPSAGRALVEVLPRQPDTTQVVILHALARLRRASDWPLLREAIPQIRHPAALRVLVKVIGAIAPAEEAVPQLVAIGQREEAGPEVLRDLVETYGWLGPDHGLTPVLRGLQSADSEVLAGAARALRRMAPLLTPAQLEQVAHSLSDLDGQARNVVILALGFSGRPEAGRVLERFLDDSGLEADHPSAWMALAMCAPSAERADLARSVIASGADETLCRSAAYFLGYAGTLDDAPRLLRLAEQRTPLSLSVAQALVALGSEAAAEPIWGWVQQAGSNYELSDKFYSHFALVPGDSVHLQLEEHLAKHPRPRFRVLAAHALAHRPSARTVEGLRAALSSADRESIKVAVVRSLGHLRDAASVPALIAMFGQTPPTELDLRRALVEALGTIGGAEARGFLAETLLTAFGTPEAVSLVYAAARCGLEVTPRQLRQINQTLRDGEELASGVLALAGDASARRWLWRDIRSPLETQMAMAHMALRELGDPAYYDLVIARAHVEGFPRLETRAVLRHLPGAPRLRTTNRPDQDADLAALRTWWATHRDGLSWDPQARQFQLRSQ